MDTDGDGGTEAHARSLVHFDNPSQALGGPLMLPARLGTADELEIEQQAGNAAAEANESYFTSLLTSLGPGTAAYDPTAGPRDHSALASPPISPHPPSAPLLATPPTSGASGLVLSKAAPSTVMARKTNAPSEPRLREILSDPLTGHYLEDAMVGRCGHSFGSATLRRVRETGSCTVCGGAVDAMTLVPNLALRAAVAAFRREETSLAALPPPVKTVKRRREVPADGHGHGHGQGHGHGHGHPDAPSSGAAKRAFRESPVQSMFAPSDVASDGHHGLDESAHQRGVQFPFAVGDHVLIRGNKRTPERFVGRLALITTQCLNGWYLVQTMDVPQEEVRLQYRSLEKLPPSSSSSAVAAAMAAVSKTATDGGGGAGIQYAATPGGIGGGVAGNHSMLSSRAGGGGVASRPRSRGGDREGRLNAAAAAAAAADASPGGAMQGQRRETRGIPGVAGDDAGRDDDLILPVRPSKAARSSRAARAADPSAASLPGVSFPLPPLPDNTLPPIDVSADADIFGSEGFSAGAIEMLPARMGMLDSPTGLTSEQLRLDLRMREARLLANNNYSNLNNTADGSSSSHQLQQQQHQLQQQQMMMMASLPPEPHLPGEALALPTAASTGRASFEAQGAVHITESETKLHRSGPLLPAGQSRIKLHDDAGQLAPAGNTPASHIKSTESAQQSQALNDPTAAPPGLAHTLPGCSLSPAVPEVVALRPTQAPKLEPGLVYSALRVKTEEEGEARGGGRGHADTSKTQCHSPPLTHGGVEGLPPGGGLPPIGDVAGGEPIAHVLGRTSASHGSYEEAELQGKEKQSTGGASIRAPGGSIVEADASGHEIGDMSAGRVLGPDAMPSVKQGEEGAKHDDLGKVTSERGGAAEDKERSKGEEAQGAGSGGVGGVGFEAGEDPLHLVGGEDLKGGGDGFGAGSGGGGRDSAVMSVKKGLRTGSRRARGGETSGGAPGKASPASGQPQGQSRSRIPTQPWHREGEEEGEEEEEEVEVLVEPKRSSRVHLMGEGLGGIRGAQGRGLVASPPGGVHQTRTGGMSWGWRGYGRAVLALAAKREDGGEEETESCHHHKAGAIVKVNHGAEPGKREREGGEVPSVRDREREREAVRVIRRDMLRLELQLPWTCVKRAWRTRRATWRRAVKESTTLGEVAARMGEFRSVLLLEGAGQISDAGWGRQLARAQSGAGDHARLQALWRQLHDDVAQWLATRASHQAGSGDEKPLARLRGRGAGGLSESLVAQMRALFPWYESAHASLPLAAITAVASIAAAEAVASKDANAEAMRAVTTKLLQRHSREELQVLRGALERERRHISALLCQLNEAYPPLLPAPPSTPSPPLSPFTQDADVVTIDSQDSPLKPKMPSPSSLGPPNATPPGAGAGKRHLSSIDTYLNAQLQQIGLGRPSALLPGSTGEPVSHGSRGHGGPSCGAAFVNMAELCAGADAPSLTMLAVRPGPELGLGPRGESVSRGGLHHAPGSPSQSGGGDGGCGEVETIPHMLGSEGELLLVDAVTGAVGRSSVPGTGRHAVYSEESGEEHPGAEGGGGGKREQHDKHELDRGVRQASHGQLSVARLPLSSASVDSLPPQQTLHFPPSQEGGGGEAESSEHEELLDRHHQEGLSRDQEAFLVAGNGVDGVADEDNGWDDDMLDRDSLSERSSQRTEVVEIGGGCEDTDTDTEMPEVVAVEGDEYDNARMAHISADDDDNDIDNVEDDNDDNGNDHGADADGGALGRDDVDTVVLDSDESGGNISVEGDGRNNLFSGVPEQIVVDSGSE